VTFHPPDLETPMSRRLIAVLALLLVSACAQAPQKPQAVASQPDSASTVAAADLARQAGHFGEAVEIYQYVLVSDPHSVPAQFGMAESLFALGRTAEAKRIFAALRKEPGYQALAVQGVGLAELVLNNREPAAAALREAVAADPQLWRAFNGLALLADLARRPDEASELYGKAMAVHPDSAVLFNNRGYSRLLSGKTDLAIADFRRALALDPSSETAVSNLRIAIAAKGDYREASRGVAREKVPVVMNNVGYVAMKRGDLVEAEAYLARAMAESASYQVTAAQNMDRLAALRGDAK
jgi:Flp pilus assembly protein TadD